MSQSPDPWARPQPAPTGSDPSATPTPDPAEVIPYPDQPAPHPTQQTPHPDQQTRYPDPQPPPHPDPQPRYPDPQPPYPGQQAPYPGRQAPYPSGAALFPPPSGPHRSGLVRSARVALLAFGAALLLCLGGGTVAAFLLRDRFAALVDRSDTTLVTPETLAGRPRLTDPDTQARAEEMIAGLNQQLPGATSTVLAVYGDPTQRDLVLVGGSADTMPDPARSLEQFRNGMRDAGLPLDGVTAIEPGPLGGVAECGDADAGEVTMGICLWADRGSLGMVIMYFRTAAQAATEFVQIRGEVEKRD